MENFNIEEYNIIDHLEVGSKVFDWMLQEWLEVKDIDKTEAYPIKTTKGSYNNNGIYISCEKTPRLTLEEWHPFSGKPFPKLPEKKVLEVLVYTDKDSCVKSGVFEKGLIPCDCNKVLERTPYTGTYLK